ncbi:MAG: sugar nucleotide-binding protein, partial [Acidimicrobiales bacterium]
MSRVLVFGADSLVGSDFVETSTRPVIAAGRSDPRNLGLEIEEFHNVDLEDSDAVERTVRDSKAGVVVSFAAATDVDAVERERPRSLAEAGGSAFRLNAQAPGSMAKATRATGKFLVVLSTDFVFDGTTGPYSELE